MHRDISVLKTYDTVRLVQEMLWTYRLQRLRGRQCAVVEVYLIYLHQRGIRPVWHESSGSGQRAGSEVNTFANQMLWVMQYRAP
jgi:hypothetical protein